MPSLFFLFRLFLLNVVFGLRQWDDYIGVDKESIKGDEWDAVGMGLSLKGRL